MKKILAVMLCAVVIIAFAVGCAQNQPPAGGAAPAADPAPADAAPAPEAGGADAQLVVAGVVFQEDQFMRLLQLGFEAAAEAAGARFIPGNTNGDAGVEAELIQTFLTQEFDGLAISPISEIASVHVLRSAAENGLNIGVSNHLFEEPFLAGSFSSDNHTLGYTVGSAARAYIESELGGSARIAIVQFQTLLPEQSGARVQGFLDALEGVDFEIVTDQCAWLQDVAITTASDILTAHPDIDIIFSANEGGTIGSTMAVQNTGNAGNVVVFGFDGSEQMVQLLQDPINILQASIAQDPFNIGVRTMEAVLREARGEANPEAGQAFIIPGILLDRNNPAGLEAFLADLQEKMG